ncbi:MAG TPA: NAD(P)-binding domain-containing protein, partial [Candidatus Dormibacteraeota bacterium]
MDIGFIGLGTMGSRVAENLVKAGNKVRVWN